MKESETAIWIHRTGTMQMKQQRATLEKRKAPKKRQKRECCGSTESPIVVARRSWSEISRGKLGTLIQQTKNSLNFVSTCLKVVDTRRAVKAADFTLMAKQRLLVVQRDLFEQLDRVGLF